MTEPSALLRSPSASPIPSPNDVLPPPLSWLSGSWIITHTTHRTLRKARKATITYTSVPDTGKFTAESVRTVQYGTLLAGSMTLVSEAGVKTISGVSKSARPTGGAKGEEAPTMYGDMLNWGERSSLVYQWRRQGWRALMARRWEILGYGDDPPTPRSPDPKSNSWVVVYSEKTWVEQAGLCVYCRPQKISPKVVRGILVALEAMGGDMAKLAGEMYEVGPDDEDTKRDLSTDSLKRSLSNEEKLKHQEKETKT